LESSFLISQFAPVVAGVIMKHTATLFSLFVGQYV